MPKPTLDFETYSAAGFVWNPPGTNPKKPLGYWSALPNAPQGKKGLPIVGASVYTEHPTAEVLSAHYDLCDGRGLRRWRPGDPLPTDLFEFIAAGGFVDAHNAMFEYLVWTNICVPKYGWPPLDEARFPLRCTMATARTNNLPGALEKLGDALGLDVKKDKEGKRLLGKFSTPRNPTQKDARTRILIDDDPEGPALLEYGDQDVRAEQTAGDAMPEMSADEYAFWLIDQEINRRGIGVDRQGIRDCIAVLEQAHEQYGAEHEELTGGLQPGQLAEVRGFLRAYGVELPNMQADTIDDALANPAGYLAPRPDGVPTPPVMHPTARRVLEIRTLLGSASVKKLFAMEYQANRHDRLQNLIVHHGARTGRPTGEGPQPLNLPKAGPKLVTCGACGKPHRPDVDACVWCGVPAPPVERKGKWSHEYVDAVLEIMAQRSLALVEWYFGDALLAIQGCVRGLFQAAEGHDLIASDYSAIEAVVAAMISGEQWRIDTFRAKRDIYLTSASKITGTAYEQYEQYAETHGDNHPDRQEIGKVAELALGYGGWEGAWRAFDPAEADKSSDEVCGIIRAWRNASPQIVAHWGGQRVLVPGVGWRDELYGIEGAVISAIQSPGVPFVPRVPSSGEVAPWPVDLRFIVLDDILRMILPSGREIKYWHPRVAPSQRRPGSLEISYMTYNTNPKYGPLGWVRMPTWGSRIYENADQAIAHDILRYAVVNLRAAGYPTVLHVYDEIVGEIPIGTGSVEQFETIMQTLPPWAAGWPIRAAGGWRGKRYRKG